MMLLDLITALAATASHPLHGPSPEELAAAIHAAPEVAGPLTIRADAIRSIRCRVVDEEPTEYRCSFKSRGADKRWERGMAIVALDRQGWVLLSLERK